MMGGTFSQYSHVSNHHDIHFKYLTTLFVNYTSIKLGVEWEDWHSIKCCREYGSFETCTVCTWHVNKYNHFGKQFCIILSLNTCVPCNSDALSLSTQPRVSLGMCASDTAIRQFKAAVFVIAEYCWQETGQIHCDRCYTAVKNKLISITNSGQKQNQAKYCLST